MSCEGVNPVQKNFARLDVERDAHKLIVRPPRALAFILRSIGGESGERGCGVVARRLLAWWLVLRAVLYALLFASAVVMSSKCSRFQTANVGLYALLVAAGVSTALVLRRFQQFCRAFLQGTRLVFPMPPLPVAGQSSGVPGSVRNLRGRIDVDSAGKSTQRTMVFLFLVSCVNSVMNASTTYEFAKLLPLEHADRAPETGWCSKALPNSVLLVFTVESIFIFWFGIMVCVTSIVLVLLTIATVRPSLTGAVAAFAQPAPGESVGEAEERVWYAFAVSNGVADAASAALSPLLVSGVAFAAVALSNNIVWFWMLVFTDVPGVSQALVVSTVSDGTFFCILWGFALRICGAAFRTASAPLLAKAAAGPGCLTLRGRAALVTLLQQRPVALRVGGVAITPALGRGVGATVLASVLPPLVKLLL